MSATFQSKTLQAIYDSDFADASTLATFRTGGGGDLTNDIDALDRRIAAFESVYIGQTANNGGQSTKDYPYDREGLKREFLDEVLALLMRRSINGIVPTNLYTNTGVLVASAGGLGGTAVVLSKTDPNAAATYGNFDNLATSSNATDGRLGLLNATGQDIFKSYQHLIDQVFTEGDKLANNPTTPTETVTAILPLAVGGVTYDQLAQVAGIDPVTKQVAYTTYLLDSTAGSSIVFKDSSGNAQLDGPSSSTAKRLQLSPTEAPLNAVTQEYDVTLDSLGIHVSTTSTGIRVRTGTSTTWVDATPSAPLALNIPGREGEFPNAKITSNYRVKLGNGSDYLIGLGSDGKVYVTSLASSRVSNVSSTANLNPLEFLLYFNEARIKILRAKLAYNEAVVREIQDDLKQANETLADLEIQDGVLPTQNSDGTASTTLSTETTKMNLFDAMASTAGQPLFLAGGSDSLHAHNEWQTNRTNLKNYIDRRSAEAQQATLDYQNTLNRFNNAYETMSKLQEKLDTLLKAQLHNFS